MFFIQHVNRCVCVFTQRPRHVCCSVARSVCARLSPGASHRSSGAAVRWDPLEIHTHTHTHTHVLVLQPDAQTASARLLGLTFISLRREDLLAALWPH